MTEIPSVESQTASVRRAHVLVRGRVQGVGYRAFAQRVARRLGLTGTVQNLLDGRVEVIAEGDPNRVEVLLGELREGPWGARVEDLEVDWSEASGEYVSFGVTFASRSGRGGYG